jgi:hypothetical protein
MDKKYHYLKWLRLGGPLLDPPLFDPKAITVKEIYEAHRTLVSVSLPSELAAIILDFAEYWYRHSCKKKVSLRFGSGGPFPEASSLYLQTPPLGNGEGFDDLPLVRPRKVIFHVVGCDHNPNRGYDHYKNGRAWFDASIFREDKSWTDGPRHEPIYALHLKALSAAPAVVIDRAHRDRKKLEHGEEFAVYYRGTDPHTLPSWFCEDGTKVEGGFKVMPNGNKQTWLLQRYALGRELNRTIRWSRRAIGKPKEKEWPVTGAGSGTNFVASLRRGDRIGVWGRTHVSRTGSWIHSDN